jgi:hypothetical protein
MFYKISSIEKSIKSLRPNNNGQRPTGQRKYCKFCEKDGHTEEKCCIEKAEKKLTKARISEIQQNSHEQSNAQTTPTKKLLKMSW